MDDYRIGQLKKMLAHEEDPEEVHYGARLSHWKKDANILTIDAGGLRALIRHYEKHNLDLGNGEEDA